MKQLFKTESVHEKGNTVIIDDDETGEIYICQENIDTQSKNVIALNLEQVNKLAIALNNWLWSNE